MPGHWLSVARAHMQGPPSLPRGRPPHISGAATSPPQPGHRLADSQPDHRVQSKVPGGLSSTAVRPQVGVTALGIGHALLSGLTFDVCLVDEAGQTPLPAVLGPLLKARALCLVGDQYQLPPLVQNERARQAGLGDSLFRQLCQQQPLVGRVSWPGRPLPWSGLVLPRRA